MSAVDRQGGADLAGQWDTDPEGLISRSPPYGSHLGQRSWHRTSKAGHMTASAFAHPLQFLLASRGPSTHDPPTEASRRWLHHSRNKAIAAPGKRKHGP